MRVKIRRQDNPFSEPYWQEFEYTGPADNSVAGVLEYLNYRDDITDTEGNPVRRISWECSCLQGVCGSCAMVINGTPELACETFLRDLKGETLVIEPLRKFPTICDLVVDRAVIEESLQKGGAFLPENAGGDSTSQATGEEALKASAVTDEHKHRYTAARCLKCGLCLEVCPNYKKGEKFYGALFANDCYLCSSLSPQGGDRPDRPQIKDAYRDHFAAGCSKAMSCMKVCPMDIPTISSMAKMNKKR